MGSTLVSTIFHGHREVLIAVAGAPIIALAVGQLLGGGFGLPGADRLQSRVATSGRARGWTGTFALGAVHGLAGFCSGPDLGVVLTLAATHGGVGGGGAVLAGYALGSAAMFVLALAVGPVRSRAAPVAARGRPDPAPAEEERRSRWSGGAGGLLTFFAVGCPVCDEVVLLALGASRAMTYFEPVQPILSVLALLLLAWALTRRLQGQVACAVPTPPLAGAVC